MFYMHLSTFFWNANIENTCHNSTKLNKKYLKVKHQLESLYFQVDEGLMCVNIVSTFHILIIIYQSFNVKYFGKSK